MRILNIRISALKGGINQIFFNTKKANLKLNREVFAQSQIYFFFFNER